MFKRRQFQKPFKGAKVFFICFWTFERQKKTVAAAAARQS